MFIVFCLLVIVSFFLFNDTATTEIYTLSLHDALPIFKEIITKAKKNYIGIRIGIDNSGCSGHSYKIDYVENKIDSDEIIFIDNIKVFIDASTTMYILGSKIDYIDNGMESGFVFNNPNEKGRCGCGESFSV